MINIFKAMRYWGDDPTKIGTYVSEYITERVLLACEGDASDWEDEISYLEMLFYRVCESPDIDKEDRSLNDILDKMDDDLAYSTGIFGARADRVLSILESDTLKAALNRSSNERECQILGHIEYLRNRYLRNEVREEREDRRTPAEIKAYLDEYIVGQDDAKIAISSAVYGHGKRVRHPDVNFAPDVVLLIGPSGCGKTEMMRRISKITEWPILCTDVSNLGAGQYRGRHKEDILMDLYLAAGKDLRKAERGIVFMDEFDKLMLPAISERGVNVHDDVQSQLLTMLEGSDIELKTDGQSLVMNTSRILFVLAGAFQGLDEFIRNDKRTKEKNTGRFGFNGVLEKDMDASFVRANINHDVLMEYGMKRELAGRVSAIAVLEKLGKAELTGILKDASDSMPERYAREVERSCGAELVFTDAAYDAIAERAFSSDTGARALRGILDRLMRPVLYDAPGMKGVKKILIDSECVTEGKAAEYIFDDYSEPLSEVIREFTEDEPDIRL